MRPLHDEETLTTITSDESCRTGVKLSNTLSNFLTLLWWHIWSVPVKIKRKFFGGDSIYTCASDAQKLAQKLGEIRIDVSTPF